jgi:hypothetical protein
MKSSSRKSPGRSSAAAPTHEAVSAAAQLLWIERGRPDNQDEAIWLEAERRLRTPAAGRTWSGSGNTESAMDELDDLYPGGSGDVRTSL